MASLKYFFNKYQTMYIESKIYKDCSGTYPYDQVIPYEVLTQQYANITNISEKFSQLRTLDLMKCP